MSRLKIWILMLANGFAYYTVWILMGLHHYYYDAFQIDFGLTNTQIGFYGLLCGGVALVSYLIGGPVADIFDTKKLLLTAYVIMIVSYLVMATFPPYHLFLVLVCISTLLAVSCFWGTFFKYIRLLGGNDPAKENYMYGLQFAFCGVGGAVLGLSGSGVIGIFGPNIGLRCVFLINSAVLVFAFIITWFFLESGSYHGPEEEPFKMCYILDILKMPAFWFVALMNLALYGTSIATAYIAPLLYKLGLPLAVTSFIGVFRFYVCRIFCAPIGGMIMSKKGSIRFISAMLVPCTLALFVLTAFTGNVVVPAITILILALCYSLTIPGWFTTLTEIGVPECKKATATGIMTSIMCSPDVYGFTLSGIALDKFGNAGYSIIFATVAVIGVVGILMGVLVKRQIKAGNETLRNVKEGQMV